MLELKTMLSQLEGVQKIIFMFWFVYVCLFVLSFINLIVFGIKLKLNKIN
jgi:hypothetical protein